MLLVVSSLILWIWTGYISRILYRKPPTKYVKVFASAAFSLAVLILLIFFEFSPSLAGSLAGEAYIGFYVAFGFHDTWLERFHKTRAGVWLLVLFLGIEYGREVLIFIYNKNTKLVSTPIGNVRNVVDSKEIDYTINLKNECVEDVSVSISYVNKNKWYTKGWWQIKSFTNVNTGERTDSNTVYIYAMSKNYSWSGDNKTGFRRQISNNAFTFSGDTVRTEPAVSIVYFIPVIVNTSDNQVYIIINCPNKQDKSEQSNSSNTKPISSNSDNIRNYKYWDFNEGSFVDIDNSSTSNSECEIKPVMTDVDIAKCNK